MNIELPDMAIEHEFKMRCGCLALNETTIRPEPPTKRQKTQTQIQKPCLVDTMSCNVRMDVIQKCFYNAAEMIKQFSHNETTWRNIPVEFSAPFFGPGFTFRKDSIVGEEMNISACLIVTHSCKINKRNYNFKHRCTSTLFDNHHVVAILRIYDTQQAKKQQRSHQRSLTSQRMYLHQKSDIVFTHIIRGLVVSNGMCVQACNMQSGSFDIGLEATNEIIRLMSQKNNTPSQKVYIAHVDFYLAPINPSHCHDSEIFRQIDNDMFRPCGFVTIKGVFCKGSPSGRQFKSLYNRSQNAIDMKCIGESIHEKIKEQFLVNITNVQRSHVHELYAVSKQILNNTEDSLDKDLLWKCFLEHMISSIRLPNGSLQPYIFEHLLMNSQQL